LVLSSQLRPDAAAAKPALSSWCLWLATIRIAESVLWPESIVESVVIRVDRHNRDMRFSIVRDIS
jgi:hypothetical protein